MREILENMQIEKRIAILRQVSIFSEVDEKILWQLASMLGNFSVVEGETVFCKGDVGNAMYIIVHGKVKIHDGDYVFTTLADEDVFGEYSLIDNKLRSASVTALEETELLRFDQVNFYQLLDVNAEFSRGVLRSMVKRLHDKDFLEEKLAESNLEISQQKELLQQQATQLEIANQDLQTREEALAEMVDKLEELYFLNEEKNRLLEKQKQEIGTQNLELMQQKEEILSQSEQLEFVNAELEKLSIVASKTDNSVVILDKNGDIEWVNEGFTRMLGMSFAEYKQLYGNNLFQVSLNPDIREVVNQSIKHKQSAIYTGKTLNKQGKEIWIQTTLTPVLDGNEHLTQLIAVETDVTQMKLAEKKIAKQNQNITDSIQYARRIQQALMPLDEVLNSIFPENFVMYKPKNIVSGDFYWLHTVNINSTKAIMLAVGDCTGHGVPGAFMSLLGISFLNEIASKIYSLEELKAYKVLNFLREMVKKALRQTGKENEARDGIDIALCILSPMSNKNVFLQYSGANSPMYVIKSNSTKSFMEGEDEGFRGDLLELKPDKMPIGIHLKEKDTFAQEEMELEEGDAIYMFSDGYVDQFGSEFVCKFLSKRFKQLLIDTQHFSIKKQYDILEQTLSEWKGEREQVDDILVMGVRIPINFDFE